MSTTKRVAFQCPSVKVVPERKFTFSKARTEGFSKVLVSWFQTSGHSRSFSWRKTSDAYRILIAELLLRRTNARSVEQVYKDFLECYPNLTRFGAAKRSELQRLLFPLGLRWRTDNIVDLANVVKNGSLEDVPSELSELKRLPGIGDYVARAILINAFGARIVAVDNNVVRILCRYFDIAVSDSLRRNAQFQDFSNELLGQYDAREFNYALLDLAATVCTARKPKCEICALRKGCVFGKESVTSNSAGVNEHK